MDAIIAELIDRPEMAAQYLEHPVQVSQKTLVQKLAPVIQMPPQTPQVQAMGFVLPANIVARACRQTIEDARAGHGAGDDESQVAMSEADKVALRDRYAAFKAARVAK